MTAGAVARSVGDVEVVPLLDAVGVLPLERMSPGVPPADWAPARARYPELFRSDDWYAPCTSYLLRSDDRTVLVDTGVGPSGLWDWIPCATGGLLLDALANVGVRPQDIDTVLLTHVHVDHVGWNADASGEAVFRRARHLVHRDALAVAHERRERPHIAQCVLALEQQGSLEAIGDETEVLRGVVTFPLPGHDPGQVGLRIKSNGARALLVADALPHPVFFEHPEWRFVMDDDHNRCVETRRLVLAELAESDAVVICGHYPGGGIGRVVTRDGAPVWEPV